MPETAQQRSHLISGRNPTTARESGRANRRCGDRSAAGTEPGAAENVGGGD